MNAEELYDAFARIDGDLLNAAAPTQDTIITKRRPARRAFRTALASLLITAVFAAAELTVFAVGASYADMTLGEYFGKVFRKEIDAGVSGVIAVVNDEPVYRSSLDFLIRSRPDVDEKTALEELIKQVLLTQEAEKRGYGARITDEAVQKTVETQIRYLKQIAALPGSEQPESARQILEYLSENNITIEEYYLSEESFRTYRNALMRSALLDDITKGETDPDKRVEILETYKDSLLKNAYVKVLIPEEQPYVIGGVSDGALNGGTVLWIAGAVLLCYLACLAVVIIKAKKRSPAYASGAAAAKRRFRTEKLRRIAAGAMIALFFVGAGVAAVYLIRGGGVAAPGDDGGAQSVQPSEQSATETDNNEPVILFEQMLDGESVEFGFDSMDDFNYETIHEEEYMGTFKNYVIDGELYSFKYVRTMPLPFLEDYVLHYRYASEEKIIGLYVLKNDSECIVFRSNASLTQGFREEKCEEAQAFAIEMISRLYGEDVSKYSCEAVFVHETSPYKVRFYINDGLYRKYIGFCDIIESDDGLDYSSYFLVPKDVIDNIPTPPYTYEEIVSMTEKAAQKKKQGAEITDVSIRGYKYSHSKKCWALEYTANIEYEEDGVPHGGWIACYMFLDNDKQE